MTRGERRLLLVLVGAALLVACLDLLFGFCPGALHLAPAAVIFLPLLLGRFPGERMLARAARAQRPAGRAQSVPLPRRLPDVNPRLLLLAGHRVSLPPPGALVVHA